jgi:hypothetical protein
MENFVCILSGMMDNSLVETAITFPKNQDDLQHFSPSL